MFKKKLFSCTVCIFLLMGVSHANDEKVITDPTIQSKIVKTIDRTITLLTNLDDNTNYGDLGWANSLTLGTAIDKLKDSIKDIKTVNVEKMKKYTLKIKDYFKDYIVSDLNSRGMREYKTILSHQEDILVRANHSVGAQVR